MGGTVKRRIVIRTALVLAIAAAVLTGSCNNNLTWWLQSWAGLDMLEVLGGSMELGDVENWPGDGDEIPVHQVTISTFEMSRYEVTQALYEFITGDAPSTWIGDTCQPVEYVNWQDAIDFCNELSRWAGLEPCYTINADRTTVTWNTAANGYRLPTEAEWEYAARGGTLSEGYAFAGSNDPTAVAWYDTTALGDGPHVVGEKGSNELGFCDMSGNVAEWCWDVYGDGSYYWSNPDDWIDPLGPTGSMAPINENTYFVARGGAHDAPDYACRNAKRLYAFDTDRSPNLGFRVARNP